MAAVAAVVIGGPALLFTVMLSGVQSAGHITISPWPGASSPPAGAVVGPSGTEYPAWLDACHRSAWMQRSLVDLGLAIGSSEDTATEDAVDVAVQAQLDLAAALTSAPASTLRDHLLAEETSFSSEVVTAAAAARRAAAHPGDDALTAEARRAAREAWSSSVDLAESVRRSVRALPGQPSCPADPDGTAWTDAGLA